MGAILHIDDPRLMALIRDDNRAIGDLIAGWHRVAPRVPLEDIPVLKGEDHPQIMQEFYDFVSNDGIEGDVYVEQFVLSKNIGPQRFVKICQVYFFFTNPDAGIAFKMRYG